MDVVKKCKAVWSSAASDTERFAAMLVIIELAKTSDLSSSQRKVIFDSIGFSFLSRLLQTEEVPQGCSAMVYKSLAVSVLSCFCSDQEIAGSEEMGSFTADFKKIIVFSTSAESLVSDTLDCIYSLSGHEKGRQHIFENQIVPCLVNLYINDTCGKSKALQILKIMTFYLKSEIWTNDSASFNELIMKMSKEFEDDIFNAETYRSILTILLDHPLHEVQGDEDWAFKIQVALTKVLRCRVIKELRDLAIKLASVMVEKFGTVWLGDDTNSSKVFFLVLIQMVSVEVQLVFEDKTVEDITADYFVLSACFSVLENIISGMVDENLGHSLRPFLRELIISLRSAYKSIIGFLSVVSAKWKPATGMSEFPLKELTYASIRVLCAWLAEETGVFQDAVCGVLPFLLDVCNESFLALLYNESAFAPAKAPHIDLMRFLIPPLCHLTADDMSRAVLLKHELPSMLFQYMYYQWSAYQHDPSAELEVLIATLCGVILNIVVMEVKVVSESEEFFSFLRFLLSSVPLLSSDFEHLCLKANFSVLGLLITKQCYKRIKSCETSFYKFLSVSVKFLWDAHHVEDENNTTAFVLVREYRSIWSDIMELWFLGIQALLTLLPVMPWIANFLMESGWPQHIVTSLSSVEENSVEESVKYAYQAFLSALVRVSKDAVPTLNKSQAVAVCRKHGLKELETLLQHS